MLNYKTLGGDILVFKNQNDCMTISRGLFGVPSIDRIEVNGEDLDIFNNDDVKHPFTEKEIQYFIDNYEQIVGPYY